MDVSLDRDGKHAGHARLPHSVHRSAYGWLPMPLVSIRNGEGPKVLLMAGVHGDEYEGQVTLARLARMLEPEDIRGQVVILPMANYPAAKAGSRVSPLDEGNLNRMFPGDPLGSPSQMIAHFIETELFSRVDVVLDLHSGGSSLNYLPSTVSLAVDNPELLARSRQLMETFGASYGVLFEGRGGIGTSYDAAVRNKIIRIGTELGGRAWVHPRYRDLCEQGALRILAHFGVIGADKTVPAGPVRFVKVPPEAFVYASADGIFEAAAELGDQVRQGDLAGRIYFPETPLRDPVEARFATDGIVICERAVAPCQVGDCLFHLGQPV
ncbi:MAG TPA: succinylglutamate desuccinylase/aspartoacylase family protein [Ramlibacter sp.]|nr:succinylglutamate desuccinylase/aspartoacylase family protein [Ramlibacter sp.]